MAAVVDSKVNAKVKKIDQRTIQRIVLQNNLQALLLRQNFRDRVSWEKQCQFTCDEFYRHEEDPLNEMPDLSRWSIDQRPKSMPEDVPWSQSVRSMSWNSADITDARGNGDNGVTNNGLGNGSVSCGGLEFPTPIWGWLGVTLWMSNGHLDHHETLSTLFRVFIACGAYTPSLDIDSRAHTLLQRAAWCKFACQLLLTLHDIKLVLHDTCKSDACNYTCNPMMSFFNLNCKSHYSNDQKHNHFRTNQRRLKTSVDISPVDVCYLQSKISHQILTRLDIQERKNYALETDMLFRLAWQSDEESFNILWTAIGNEPPSKLLKRLSGSWIVNEFEIPFMAIIAASPDGIWQTVTMNKSFLQVAMPIQYDSVESVKADKTLSANQVHGVKITPLNMCLDIPNHLKLCGGCPWKEMDNRGAWLVPRMSAEQLNRYHYRNGKTALMMTLESGLTQTFTALLKRSNEIDFCAQRIICGPSGPSGLTVNGVAGAQTMLWSQQTRYAGDAADEYCERWSTPYHIRATMSHLVQDLISKTSAQRVQILKVVDVAKSILLDCGIPSAVIGLVSLYVTLPKNYTPESRPKIPDGATIFSFDDVEEEPDVDADADVDVDSGDDDKNDVAEADGDVETDIEADNYVDAKGVDDSSGDSSDIVSTHSSHIPVAPNASDAVGSTSSTSSETHRRLAAGAKRKDMTSTSSADDLLSNKKAKH